VAVFVALAITTISLSPSKQGQIPLEASLFKLEYALDATLATLLYALPA